MEGRRGTATRLKVAGLVFGLFVAAAVPVFGHATFPSAPSFDFLPNTSGGTGSVNSTPPYPPDTAITAFLRVPYEQTEPFNGAPDTTVDVEVTVPGGWTDPVCGPATTNKNDATTGFTPQPGTEVPDWTCAVETSGANTVLHWSGPQVTPPGTPLDSAQFFEFTVTTPSPETQTTYDGTGGTEGFIVNQVYASGEVVRWIPSAEVPGGGVVSFGLARTVAGTGVTTTTTSSTTTSSTTTTTTVVPGSGTCGDLSATIVGTPGPDRLTGTDGPDVIVGLGGDDRIDGLGGDDVICADAGNDVVDGGAGDDRVTGAAGDDRLVGQSGRDDLRGGEGADTIGGGGGNDRLVGGPDVDTCDGGSGTNSFQGCETKTPTLASTSVAPTSPFSSSPTLRAPQL